MKSTKLIILTLLLLTGACRKEEPATPEPTPEYNIEILPWCSDCFFSFINEMGIEQEFFMDNDVYPSPSIKRNPVVGPMKVKQGQSISVKFKRDGVVPFGLIYMFIRNADSDTLMATVTNTNAIKPVFEYKWTAP